MRPGDFKFILGSASGAPVAGLSSPQSCVEPRLRPVQVPAIFMRSTSTEPMVLAPSV